MTNKSNRRSFMNQSKQNRKSNSHNNPSLHHSLNGYTDVLSILPEEKIRQHIPEMRYPLSVDFSCEIGGTEYIVTSHFNQDAHEAIYNKIARMLKTEVVG